MLDDRRPCERLHGEPFGEQLLDRELLVRCPCAALDLTEDFVEVFLRRTLGPEAALGVLTTALPSPGRW